MCNTVPLILVLNVFCISCVCTCTQRLLYQLYVCACCSWENQCEVFLVEFVLLLLRCKFIHGIWRNVSRCGGFSGPYFLVFGLSTEIYFSPNRGKYGPEETPYLDTFHTLHKRSPNNGVFSDAYFPVFGYFLHSHNDVHGRKICVM